MDLSFLYLKPYSLPFLIDIFKDGFFYLRGKVFIDLIDLNYCLSFDNSSTIFLMGYLLYYLDFIGTYLGLIENICKDF